MLKSSNNQFIQKPLFTQSIGAGRKKMQVYLATIYVLSCKTSLIYHSKTAYINVSCIILFINSVILILGVIFVKVYRMSTS